MTPTRIPIEKVEPLTTPLQEQDHMKQGFWVKEDKTPDPLFYSTELQRTERDNENDREIVWDRW